MCVCAGGGGGGGGGGALLEIDYSILQIPGHTLTSRILKEIKCLHQTFIS